MTSMTRRYGTKWLIGQAILGWLAMTFQAQAAAMPRLLVLGDSLTAGYGLPHQDGFQARLSAALAAAGHPATLVDAAVSGDTSAGGRARLDWALGDGVDAAIVELGANDGLRALDPAEMAANLTAILDTRSRQKHIPVLLSGMYAAAEPRPRLRPTGFGRCSTQLGQASRRDLRPVLPRSGGRQPRS